MYKYNIEKKSLLWIGLDLLLEVSEFRFETAEPETGVCFTLASDLDELFMLLINSNQISFLFAPELLKSKINQIKHTDYFSCTRIISF